MITNETIFVIVLLVVFLLLLLKLIFLTNVFKNVYEEENKLAEALRLIDEAQNLLLDSKEILEEHRGVSFKVKWY